MADSVFPVEEYNQTAWGWTQRRSSQVPQPTELQMHRREQMSAWFSAYQGKSFLQRWNANWGERFAFGWRHVLSNRFAWTANWAERLAFAWRYVLSNQFGDPRGAATIPESSLGHLHIERIETCTVEYQMAAFGLVKEHPQEAARVFALRKARTYQFIRAVSAVEQFEMERTRQKRVHARVEEVTETDVIVAFDDEEVGWYNLTIPRAQFREVPPVGSGVTVDVLLEVGRGVVQFGVPRGYRPHVAICSESEKVTRHVLPPEPDDYDDPAQAEQYERKLLEHFHVK